MHVLFLHSYFCNPEAVSGSRSYELCRGLVAQGHRVTVVCQVCDLNKGMFEAIPGVFKYLVSDGIDVVGINVAYSNHMGVFRRLLSFFMFMLLSTFVALKVKGVDIVFATSTPPTIAVPALFVKWFKRVPFVFELRDIWPDFVEQLNVLPNCPKFVFRVIDFLMVGVYKAADHLTTTTPGMTDIIRNKKVTTKSLGTILLGANRQAFLLPQSKHALFDNPILKDKFVVGFVGSVSSGYGLERLLQLAEKFQKQSKRVAFLIVGRGNRFQAINELITEMRLVNIVLHEAVPYSQVPSILKNLKVGYESSVPSTASDCALDNKFYDYISAGLPILSNYDGDMGDLLRKHDCGTVSCDIEEEVAFIESILNSENRYNEMSANSFVLSGKLDRKKQVDCFTETLETVLRSR